MKHILVFAGTSDGRAMIEAFRQIKVSLTVCVTTEYGKSLLPEQENMTVIANPLTASQIIELMEQHDFIGVIDATHPYAMEASKNIQQAASNLQIPYLRLERQSVECSPDFDASCIYLPDVAGAVNYLNQQTGAALLTTGSKDLAGFTKVHNFSARLYPRILPAVASLEQALSLGYAVSHIFCAQGPFSADFNESMLREVQADFLVTKESGKNGGFEEKVIAAKRAGAKVIVICRPPKEPGRSEREIIQWVQANCLEENK